MVPSSSCVNEETRQPSTFYLRVTSYQVGSSPCPYPKLRSRPTGPRRVSGQKTPRCRNGETLSLVLRPHPRLFRKTRSLSELSGPPPDDFPWGPRRVPADLREPLPLLQVMVSLSVPPLRRPGKSRGDRRHRGGREGHWSGPSLPETRFGTRTVFERWGGTSANNHETNFHPTLQARFYPSKQKFILPFPHTFVWTVLFPSNYKDKHYGHLSPPVFVHTTPDTSGPVNKKILPLSPHRRPRQVRRCGRDDTPTEDGVSTPGREAEESRPSGPYQDECRHKVGTSDPHRPSSTT